MKKICSILAFALIATSSTVNSYYSVEATITNHTNQTLTVDIQNLNCIDYDAMEVNGKKVTSIAIAQNNTETITVWNSERFITCSNKDSQFTLSVGNCPPNACGTLNFYGSIKSESWAAHNNNPETIKLSQIQHDASNEKTTMKIDLYDSSSQNKVEKDKKQFLAKAIE